MAALSIPAANHSQEHREQLPVVGEPVANVDRQAQHPLAHRNVLRGTFGAQDTDTIVRSWIAMLEGLGCVHTVPKHDKRAIAPGQPATSHSLEIYSEPQITALGRSVIQYSCSLGPIRELTTDPRMTKGG
ncbi:MAG: hypothetical protein GY854_15060 [Deltaproteobacteria bacterium]|nr:hypothetical protein [Deltaproteobacteria bacterium]